jgi:type II secretion system protein I
MIVFKNKFRSGFTLIEVLLAMAIIGLVLTPVFTGQSAISASVARARRAFGAILAAKNFLIDTEFNLAPDARTFATSKKSDEGTILKYELKPLPDSSSLKKFKNVLIQSVTIQSPKARSKKQERVVTFIYKPEKSSEKSGV